MGEVIKAYKGFNKDMTCRDFRYEEGKEYEEERAKACNCGFHACEYPLDCLGYYDPAHSVYREVEQSGECGCEEFAINHPEEVIESLKQWKADHEKKPIETENIWYAVIMDEKRNVVYEEKTNETIITSDMKEEVLKKYCSEHDGKYYAISERRCVVKE